MSLNTKKMAVAALLTAVAALLSILFRMISGMAMPPFLRFSLAPAVVIFAGAKLGYGFGAFVGAATDLLSFMYSPGAYFPMFTVTMALYGVMGAAFFSRDTSPLRVVLGVIIIQTALSACLNTVWNIVLYGPMDSVKLSLRLATSYLACACYIFILLPLFRLQAKWIPK